MTDPWFLAELSAVALNLGFTICIAWERRIGWLMGFVASTISVALYMHKAAWAMTALNIFYAGMGLYGWWSWGRKHDEQKITRRPLTFHIALIVACLVVAAGLSWAMDRWVHGTYPQMDAFITVFSFAATWMMAHRLIENWFYWTIGDVVAVYFNHLIGYDAYALLNIGYIILAIVGLFKWSRAMRMQQVSTLAARPLDQA